MSLFVSRQPYFYAWGSNCERGTIVISIKGSRCELICFLAVDLPTAGGAEEGNQSVLGLSFVELLRSGSGFVKFESLWWQSLICYVR